MTARVKRMNGWWYVQYRTEKQAWGRHHYGSLFDCLRAWWAMRRDRKPLQHMRPYGEHLMRDMLPQLDEPSFHARVVREAMEDAASV